VVFGGGLKNHREASVAGTGGTVSDGVLTENKQYLGAFDVVDVRSRDEALESVAKIAVACRFA
jgi:hypothetical protein